MIRINVFADLYEVFKQFVLTGSGFVPRIQMMPYLDDHGSKGVVVILYIDGALISTF